MFHVMHTGLLIMDVLARPPFKAVVDDAWAFMRPHTIFGTTLAISAMTASCLLAVHASLAAYFPNMLVLWLCYLLTNVYVVGLNQITDVDIDRINKPYLPIAAGHLSVERAIFIVLLCLGAALVIAFALGPVVIITVIISLLIGTAYSLPPIRLKRKPLLAALSIIAVRAILINISSYLYWQGLLGPELTLGSVVVILTVFMAMLVTVIAVYKDMPDITGDVLHGIQTLPARIGRRMSMRLVLSVLVLAYSWAITAALVLQPSVNLAAFVSGHAVLLLAVFRRSRRVDLKDDSSTTAFYMFIWRLLYMEYLLIPITVLLR